MIPGAALGLVVAFAMQGALLDGFERLSGWTPHPADGVELTIRSDSGRRGRALRLDFAFAGGGWAIARKTLALDLPSNYAFSFWVRGTALPNTLEFKLVDSTGENVWWHTERDFEFAREWRKVTIRRRDITFAWGPLGGGEVRRVAALELAITAGRGGGAGTVWVDDLQLTPLPESGPYTLSPTIVASTTLSGHSASGAIDGDTTTSWRGAAASGAVTLTIDFLRVREYGGLTLVWEPQRSARAYVVLASDDGRRWHTLRRVHAGNGRRDHLFLPDAASRYVRFAFERAERASNGFGLREIRVEPLEWGASRNAFFAAVAHDAPPGWYPRGFLGQRAPWTVVGVDRAPEEALLGEDGALETGAGAFSLEPFLFAGGRLLTWADSGERETWLEGGVPVPATRWRRGPLSLTVTAFATGSDTASSVVARYRLVNESDSAATLTLFLAVRPFQVNPPFQFLNIVGGAARIDSLRWEPGRLLVNGDRMVVPLSPPARFGATAFESGEIVEYLDRGTLPAAGAARDRFGAASGALEFPVTLAARGSWTVSVEVPLVAGGRARLAAGGEPAADAALAASIATWTKQVDRVTITLPRAGDAVSQTIRSTLGHILINCDGAAIQPGSRAYARSWIRDGALTSTALLRFGHADAARAFLEWFAPYQYPNGKVPCCVDARGADPVPEHDSHGELIYLVAEYYRHTGDRALPERLWPNVLAAVRHLDSLRHTHRTAAFERDSTRMYYGLLPPSISHEGYSAKPMHSYWDDFWALRGFKDAVSLAATLGHDAEATRLAAIRDEFQRDLYTSLERAMAFHRIDYLPGAADLGDFDATSTTIAVAPGGELERLPRPALDATFERYWREASARRDSTSRWEAYTPYELRAVGTFVRLGQKARAHALLEGFLADQEPAGWRQWPEVVWRDRRIPRFLGDLPHTWVGADFLRSVADMFAWEREADSALMIGAGIPETWLADSGVAVRGLSTWWGPLTLSVRDENGDAVLRIGGAVRAPPGGVIVTSPRDQRPRRAAIDGNPVAVDGTGTVVVRRLPATVTFSY